MPAPEVVKKDEKCTHSGRKIVTKETQEGCLSC